MSETTYQLTAIMFTDIAGYTTLMGSDEDKAFEVLSANKEIHTKYLTLFGGNLIKEIGDGMLISFPLPSNAVKCAIEIQKECKAREIPLRIGIHEGEVALDGEDVFGDGVNIASRLQGVDIEGTINISEKVYSEIKNKAGIRTQFLGEKNLKNVEHSLKVYQIVYDQTTERPRKAQGQKKNKSPRKRNLYYIGGFVIMLLVIGFTYRYFITESTDIEKSIAILPFKDLSAGQDNQYFCDGIMDGIHTHLSSIKDLRLVSSTSTEKYRNSLAPAKQIAKELNIRYLLEASVFKSGERIRVTTKLIDAIIDEQVWSQQYDRNLSDLFEVMSEISQQVAIEIKVLISAEVKERIEKIPTDNMKAYNLYLQGRYYWILEGKENFEKSLEFYQEALELDPNFSLAYVGMATTYNSYGWYVYLPNKDVLPLAKENALKALEKDQSLGEAHAELGFAYMLLDWDWDKAEEEFKYAIELNPNSERSHAMYAWLLSAVGRHEEAIKENIIAHQLDPLNVAYWVNLGRRYLYARDYDAAVAEFRKVIEVYPNKNYSSVSWYARAYLANALALKGLTDEAIDEFEIADYEPTWIAYLGYWYGIAGEREKATEILHHYFELNKEQNIWNGFIAIVYLGLGEENKAIEYLGKGVDQHEGVVIFLKMEQVFDSLRSDQRYLDLMNKVGFPGSY